MDRHRRQVVAGRRSPTGRSPGSSGPIVPTGPACHGCARSQRSVASPSARSSKGLNVAAGAERPPHALDDDLQAPLGQQPAEQQPHELAPPVRRAHEHGGRGPVGALAGHPAVGQQHRPVVHRGAQVAAADHVEGLRPRQPHAPRQDLAGERQSRFRAPLMGRGSHGRRPARDNAAMPKEARLTQTPGGKVPEGAGWFVLNAREARWLDGDFGAYTRFEGDERWRHLGINIGVLQPGQPACYYHGEDRPGGLPGAQRRVPAAHRGPGAPPAGVGLRPLPAVDRARLRRRGRRALRGAGGRQPHRRRRRSIRCPSWPSATAPASGARPAIRQRPTPTSPTTSRPPTRPAGCPTSR